MLRITSPAWAAVVLLACFAVQRSRAEDPSPAPLSGEVHILYLTDCTLYSNWMSVGMAFSFKNSGQKGKITRVMCCTDEEKASYPKDMLTIMDTHVAPSFAFDKKTNDHYAAFNKPG